MYNVSFSLILVCIFHSHLFGPQVIPHPKKLLTKNSHFNHYARINNDVPGFHKLIRDGKHCDSCSIEKAKSDTEFYRNLRERFMSRRSIIGEFYRNQLGGNSTTNRTIIGMHIRAGNGESGDFSLRGRNISDVDVWLENLANLLLTQSRSQNWGNAVLFIATDTPSLIDRLQTKLQQMKWSSETAISVIKRDQFRPAEGSGVLFGQQGNIEHKNEDCLRGWEDAIHDMLLLSQVDVLIAARPSSFTQSLPMSLLLASEGKSRRFMDPYCEVNLNATKMKCFGNFTDWCCRGRTSFALQGIQRYEYLRMPGKLFDSELNSDDLDLQKKLRIRKRPESGCIPLPIGSKQICLPYDWSNFVVKPRSIVIEST
jgi:Nodulation protein Z (NodZ)